MSYKLLSGTAAILAYGLSTTACSIVDTAPAARLGLPETGDAPLPCRVTGNPSLLARRVFVPPGVEARARDSRENRFEVRFATAKSHCFAVEWPSASDGRREASCPLHGVDPNAMATAVHYGETPSASESEVGAARSLFGVPGHADEERAARAPWHLRSADGAPGETDVAGFVHIGGGRTLHVFSDGGLDTHRLLAQAMTSNGQALGPVLELSPAEGSVIGQPSAAIDSNGDGLVTYIASMDGEFDVLATPISCAAR
jgi:hypothetical protein